VLLLFLAWGGCQSLQQEGTRSPEMRLLDDIRFLDYESAAGDAVYVAAQMYGLQPVVAGAPVVPWSGRDQRGHNVLAYVAGRHPGHATELVIVGADLDSPLNQGLIALLDLARRYGQDADRGFMPDYTIMMGAFSGSATHHAGLRAYLQRPLWPTSHVRALVYIAPIDSVGLAEIAKEIDMTLHVVVSGVQDTTATPQVIVADADRLSQKTDTLLRSISVVGQE